MTRRRRGRAGPDPGPGHRAHPRRRLFVRVACRRRGRAGPQAGGGVGGREGIAPQLRPGSGRGHGAPLVDPRRRVRGDVHAPRGHHHRPGGPAHHAAVIARELQRPAMGHLGLRPEPLGLHPDPGVPGRPVRAQAHLHDRPHRVHPGVLCMRDVSHLGAAHRRPSRPGCGRGGAVRHVARPHRPGLPGLGPFLGHRGVGGHGRWSGGDRAAGRGRAHERLRMAVDLLRERPHRRPDAAGGPAHGQHDRPQCQTIGLGGPGDVLGRPVPPRARSHPGQRRRVVEPRDRAHPGRRGRPAPGVRDRRAAPGTPHVRPVAVPQAGSFTGVSMATLAIGAGMFALLPYLTLYLQNDLGLSPLQGGERSCRSRSCRSSCPWRRGR